MYTFRDGLVLEVTHHTATYNTYIPGWYGNERLVPVSTVVSAGMKIVILHLDVVTGSVTVVPICYVCYVLSRQMWCLLVHATLVGQFEYVTGNYRLLLFTFCSF